MATATTANPPTLAEAEAAFAALHDRLLTGDPAVTPRAYAEARDAVDFATARQDAAQRAAVQQAEEERRQRVDAARARLAALDTAAHDAARDQLRAALDALARETVAWSAELSAIVAVPGVGYGSTPGQVTLGGVTRRPLPFQSLVRVLVIDVVREHFGPRQPVDLNYPPD